MAKRQIHDTEEIAHTDEDHSRKDLIAYLAFAAILIAAAYLYYTKAI